MCKARCTLRVCSCAMGSGTAAAGHDPPARITHGLWVCALSYAVFGHVLVAAQTSSWVSKLDHGKVQGFPSYDEATQLLDSFLLQYPDLLQKHEIGSSIENRTINAYVISLKGKRPFPEVPRVLLTALMHAREPAGLTVLLYIIGHLLELYEQGDPQARYIIQTRVIWAVPFVNPDGYIANENLRSKNIRKNRRPTCPNASEAGGVDLNRNFAFHWSSQFANCNEEYAGTKPFSEPETRALKKTIEEHPFVAAVNFHSFGGMLTHPYNYGRKRLPADDQHIYDEIATVFDWPKFGPAIQTVGYKTNGESDDWMYDTHKIISMSPEVGPESGGFWPSTSLVAGIDERNFKRTMSVVRKAGFELGSTWTQTALKEQSLPGDVRDSLKSAGGASPNVLTVRLENTGLTASSGEALNVAILGAVKAGARHDRPKEVPAFIVDMREQAQPNGFLAHLAGTAQRALAVVFQAKALPRRSSNEFQVVLPESIAVSGNPAVALCAVEVPADAATPALCQCQGSASVPAVGQAAPPVGSAILVEGRESGDEYQSLCALAASFNTGREAAAPASRASSAAPAEIVSLTPAAGSTSALMGKAQSLGSPVVPHASDGRGSMARAAIVAATAMLGLCFVVQLLVSRHRRARISVEEAELESVYHDVSSDDERKALHSRGDSSKV